MNQKVVHALALSLFVSILLPFNVNADDTALQATYLQDGDSIEEYVCAGNDCDVVYDDYDWYYFDAFEGDVITLEIWNKGYPDMTYVAVQSWDSNGEEIYTDNGEPYELWIGDTQTHTIIFDMSIYWSEWFQYRLSTVDGWGGDGTYYQISVDYDTTNRNTDGDSYIDSDDDCDNVAGTSSANLQGCLDSDGDTWANSEDACPSDVSQHLDSDLDGVCDGYDWNPIDSTQSEDSDGDGYGDNAGGNQGDHFPSDNTQWYDNDNDGFGDNADGQNPDACRFTSGNSTNDRFGCPDGDGDGWSDSDDNWTAHPIGLADAFPEDNSQWADSDGDGFGDNLGGNQPDSCVDTLGNSTSGGFGCIDDDGDSWNDEMEDFPFDATQWLDTDQDNFGDNPDGNQPDNCPTVWGNSTEDRFGCIDYDSDGWSDPDAQWNITDGADWAWDDITQWSDSDDDGYGDNLSGTEGDTCPNENGNSTKDRYGCIDSNGDGYSDMNGYFSTALAKAFYDGEPGDVFSMLLPIMLVAVIVYLNKKPDSEEKQADEVDETSLSKNPPSFPEAKG